MIHFDTLRYVETLENSGIPENQAKAMAKAHQEAMSESFLKLLKWIIGFVFAGIAALILKTFF